MWFAISGVEVIGYFALRSSLLTEVVACRVPIARVVDHALQRAVAVDVAAAVVACRFVFCLLHFGKV